MPSSDGITADLNYSEVRLFRLSGLGENSFVRAASPQTESVFITEKRRSGREIRAAVFVSEKGCRYGSWDRSGKRVRGECRNTRLQMGICELFH